MTPPKHPLGILLARFIYTLAPGVRLVGNVLERK